MVNLFVGMWALLQNNLHHVKQLLIKELINPVIKRPLYLVHISDVHVTIQEVQNQLQLSPVAPGSSHNNAVKAVLLRQCNSPVKQPRGGPCILFEQLGQLRIVVADGAPAQDPGQVVARTQGQHPGLALPVQGQPVHLAQHPAHAAVPRTHQHPQGHKGPEHPQAERGNDVQAVSGTRV